MSGGVVSNNGCFMGTFGGTGTSTVDGAGSTWTINGDLSVGDVFGGVGTVTISEGGQVTDVNGLIADGSSSTGSVQVDGAGSTWTNGGNVYVGGDASGAAGVGELNLTDRGTARSAAVTVSGLGTISGDGSVQTAKLTNHGTLAPDSVITISGGSWFRLNCYYVVDG